MKLKPTTVFLVSLLFVAAGIAITMATGLWQTESNKIPRLLNADVLETNVETEGETATLYDPADIRGSYSFGEISELYGVPLEKLAQAFGVPQEGAAAFQAKALESLYPEEEQELGTASIRMFVAYYLGLPYTPTEETWLPAGALEILTADGNMTAEQVAYAQDHTLPGN